MPSQRPPQPTSASEPPPRRAVVWIVDDSPLHRRDFQRALSPHYEVQVFAAGAIMLEHLARDRAPDVLVLDWFMPDLSGSEICTFIRETMNLAQLPILILTVAEADDDLLEALRGGANDFVNKSVSLPELDARIANLVRTGALHASLAEAERKLRLEAAFRERFMGMLAHDLRQPLNTLLMSSQLLAGLGPSEKAAPVIERQLRATRRMQRMIADLLDLTRNRPESGMPVHRRPIDFAEVARASVDELRSAHPNRDLELCIEGTCHGHWDPDRLAQVLSNLIGNAIEHGAPNCRVQVRLTADEHTVQLSVANPGPPVPESVLTALLQPASQRAEARRAGGALGLLIVQQIVLAHGGTFSAQNQDQETLFVVGLPRALPDSTQ